MFHTFVQNNSGGVWDGPCFVCVECDSPEEANIISLNHGVYFNGVRDGKDCECCGDRWSLASKLRLTATPSYYGSPLTEKEDYIIVYKDGRIVRG